MRNFIASAIELPPELGDQCCGLIFIGPLEDSPGHNRNDPCDRTHGKENRQREHQQKFAAKAQGFSVPSQTFCNRQPPSRSSGPTPDICAQRNCSPQMQQGNHTLRLQQSVFGGEQTAAGSPSNFGSWQSQPRRKLTERNLGVERSQRNSHQSHLGSARVHGLQAQPGVASVQRDSLRNHPPQRIRCVDSRGSPAPTRGPAEPRRASAALVISAPVGNRKA